MQLSVLDIEDVVATQLCTGCGACAYLAPDHLTMIDDVDHGRRPVRIAPITAPPREAIAACPGIGLEHQKRSPERTPLGELQAGWGPVLEIWEGYASDHAVRFAGSSGGAATALALYCMEHEQMHGTLHIAARPDAPYLNHTVLSTTRRQLMDATGSRYAPASPCDGLQMIEDAPQPCVFIGKPCDVAAVHKTRRLRPALDRNVGLTIAIFCAGTPTTRATFDLLRRLGIDDPTDVVSLRYRGNGWPGEVCAVVRTERGTETRTMSYEESWGEILTNNKQWRCHVCPDHTGEFADIAVGDPWHQPIAPGDPGRSLIVARTERGRRILNAAIKAGYLVAARTAPGTLPASQPNLLRGRGAVWARLLVCRMFGVSTPHFRNLPMFRFWLTELTFNEKVRSLLGTVKRISRRSLRDRVALHPFVLPQPSQTISQPRRAAA